jgi:aryl-alcohol dehydrogenase-like predicted oxidoreductase
VNRSSRHHVLGNSGLRVSRLALGTMTFGTEWGWGADKQAAKALFNEYVDAGGNLVDTADLYTVDADPNLTHRADPVLTRGWMPTA